MGASTQPRRMWEHDTGPVAGLKSSDTLRSRQIGNVTGFWYQRFGTEGSTPSCAAVPFTVGTPLGLG